MQSPKAAEIQRLRQTKITGSFLEMAQQIAPLQRLAVPGAENQIIRLMKLRTVPGAVESTVDLTAAIKRNEPIAGLSLHVIEFAS